jgi:Putative auto-transporter adhesin, head GIN domain
MNKVFKLGMAATGFLACFAIAQAAPEVATETRPIDARVVRVKLDGAVDLRIRQGSAATLTLSGDPRWLARTVTVQSGDTLNIDTDAHGRLRLGSLHAELTLPALREVSSESLGSTDVSGFSGDELELSLDGAGSMRISCNYRMVTASLGGVGSMNLTSLNGEGVDLNLRGAGFVTLNGRAKWLKADLGGLGSLDAKEFVADSVNVDLSGLGNASVTAHQNASLNLSGMGSVTVYGKPLNRKVAVDGLGKVSWK